MPNGPPKFVYLERVSKFSFKHPLLEIWNNGHILNSKKLLVLANEGVFLQPNIRENGIFFNAGNQAWVSTEIGSSMPGDLCNN